MANLVSALWAATSIAALTPPPSNGDANLAVEDAWQRRNGIMGTFLEPGQDLGFASRPTNVMIERCTREDNRSVQGDNGVRIEVPGYDCIVTIFPVAQPAYKTPAFFHYSGYGWRAEVNLREPIGLEQERLQPSTFGSKQSPKPGAIDYDGRRGIDPNYNPYRDIMSDYNYEF
ncbi:MAG: hypothetical protein AAFY84_03510 [Pseudomonadota bacterium]